MISSRIPAREGEGERAVAVIDLETFEEMANRLYDEIPPALLEGLNGGILISQEARQDDPDLPDVYILGEYIDDPYGLGNYIVLYYGSFCQVLKDEPAEVWEDELWETMLHELRHHIELRAGVYDLELEDLRQLEEFRRQLGLGSREDAGDDPADRWDEEDLDEWDEPDEPEEPGEPGEEEVPRRGRESGRR